MSVIAIIALICAIISVVLAVVDNGWRSPLLWVAWAFAVLYIIGPLS